MQSTLEATRNPAAMTNSSNVPWTYLAFCCLPLLAFRLAIFFLTSAQGDFITYWAAGHLFLTHGDPYSTAATFAIERSYGWTLPHPYVTFCPLWTLPLLGAMASLPFPAAHTAWFAISLLLNGFSAIALWLYFGGERRKAWIALMVALTFLPMGGAELLGQITPLILASLAAFLLLQKSGRYFAAGLVLYGFGAKPQLLYLVSLAILIWIFQTRAWTMLAGALVSYGAATAAALLDNPASLGYFHKTFGSAMQISCGIGGALRGVFGFEHAWLQFAPTVCGLLWFLTYFAKHRRHFELQSHLPLLAIVSVCTAPYCWYHDFILILPALVALAVHGAYRSGRALAMYAATQAIVIVTVQWSVAWMCVASLLWIAVYLVGHLKPGVSPTPRSMPAISSSKAQWRQTIR